MKHLTTVSKKRSWKQLGLNGEGREMPHHADAKTDFLNAMWRAWSNYLYDKKNEISTIS